MLKNSIKLAVLGSGNIGGTLGAKWVAAGHSVVFGVRDPSSAKAQSALVKAGTGARLDTVPNALGLSDVIVITVPSNAVEQTIAGQTANLNGKIIVDTTNRFGAPVVNQLATIAAVAPEAHLYRAFNSLGWENFADPVIDGERVDLFYCGPAGEHQRTVETLITDVGLHPIYVGAIETAPLVDSIGSLWVELVFRQQKARRMAFRVLGG